jgi:hypothetical protein
MTHTFSYMTGVDYIHLKNKYIVLSLILKAMAHTSYAVIRVPMRTVFFPKILFVLFYFGKFNKNR